jgi:hypothetical protein
MKVYVKNASGKDYDPDDTDYSDVPAGYTSWIDYWNKSRFSNKKNMLEFVVIAEKKQMTLMAVMLII